MNLLKFAPAIALALTFTQTLADELPPGPLRMLVGFAAGGGNDVMARLVATQFQLNTKETMVVENKPGAGGTVAATELARAKANGSVLMLGSVAGQAIAPSLYKLPYDPVKGVQPVAMIARSPVVLVANSQLPFKTLKEMLAYAKANPGKLNAASAGNGSVAHLSVELLKKSAGVFITHIPYRGDAPAVQDVMAGQAQMAFTSLPAALAAADTGKVRILAVSSAKRVSSLPNVPTVAEGGVPGYDVLSWYGVFTTGGTPMPTVNRLSQEIATIVNQPAFRDAVTKMGVEPSAMNAAQFTELVNSDMQKWDQLVKAIGVKLD